METIVPETDGRVGLRGAYPAGFGNEIHYVVKPAFDVPEFLVKRLLKRDSTKTIEQLRREMAGHYSR